MPKLPLYTVDAFTDVPFAGNPAAICLVGDKSLPEAVMQQLASEMNISETAYIQLLDTGDDYKMAKRFGLRWFTPTNEVALCGHATLASAAILFLECKNENEEVVFSTLSGDLKARRQEGKITLDFPNREPEEVDAKEWHNVVAAVLGDSGKSHAHSVSLSTAAQKLLIRLADTCTRKELLAIKPDCATMMLCHDGSVFKGVVVTVKGEGKYDFFSRYFGPWNGIPEDPVTGSAHTVLGPYWAGVLGKKTMYARQCSRRGGDLEVFVREDGRVDLTGFATVVVSGQVNIPV